LILGPAAFKQQHSRQATKSWFDADLSGNGQILAFDLIVGANDLDRARRRMCKIVSPISLKGPSRSPWHNQTHSGGLNFPHEFAAASATATICNSTRATASPRGLIAIVQSRFDMLEEDWDEFPQILREMLIAGLVVRRDDGTYALTILGLLEVENDSDTEGGNGAPAAARHPSSFLVESATSSPRQ
jgi:hypothetical protein